MKQRPQIMEEVEKLQLPFKDKVWNTFGEKKTKTKVGGFTQEEMTKC